MQRHSSSSDAAKVQYGPNYNALDELFTTFREVPLDRDVVRYIITVQFVPILSTLKRVLMGEMTPVSYACRRVRGMAPVV